ncbi:hypothetical protein [Paenibacillus albus]|uniref:Uncharacterized protein n=1 Tax=Paenibacillus albus TaxID=2495582 RepID=A0A3Q8X2X7_9BACL|nr:hypothetical protein [Paenibacillus albus]AZN39246.1 hypothetical protein EJC50_05880 [Paenibacillus albus]
MRQNIERFMWVSALKPSMEEAFVQELNEQREQLQISLQKQGVLVCSVFREGSYLFTYMEQEGEGRIGGSLWNEALTPMLQGWPVLALDGGPAETYEMRMNDIFHDDCEVGDVPWRRPGYRAERRVGSLARLRPDLYSSYVFLHYQLQEEKPRQFNKYYTIGSFGSYIFSYQELPAVVEPPRIGQISTKNSPINWGEVMEPHFEPWTEKLDAERLWCVLEELFHYE